jgi:hypothetical protein
MRKHALRAIALACTLFAGNSSLADANEPLPEEVEFINAYLQAHGTKDLDASLRLFSFGNDAGMKDSLRTILAYSFNITIKSIEFVPQNVPPIGKGARARKAPLPSPHLGRTLVIRFAPNIAYDSFSFPGELKDGKFLVAAPGRAGEK